jgi:nicotinamidase-related amidase
MDRLAKMVDRISGTKKVKKIHVTLDCHHLFDIAHPGMWRNSSGENPDPFTIITYQDIVDGKWFPVFASLPWHSNAREYVKEYAKALEDSGKYALCIWPPHCLIGSRGNGVVPSLFDAFIKWEQGARDNIDYVSKGSTMTTEHYSAVKAEVPEPSDPTTQLNTRLIKTLMEADTIFFAGEAGSHCVKNTIEDIADGFGDDTYVKKLVMLEDAVSPVQSPYVDFPAIQQQFVEDMKARGMRVAKTTDF